VLRAGPALLPTGSLAIKKSALGVLFLTVFIDLLGFGIVLPLLPRYARDFNASYGQIGLLLASFSAMQFLFAPIWGRMSDRFGRRPLIMLGLGGSVASYALFAVADTYVLLLISRLAAGMFGATIGTAQAYIADVTGKEDRGKQMALIGAAFGIGFTFGPAVGGLADHYIGRWAPGAVAAAFSLIALVLAWRVLPEPDRHRPPVQRRFFDFAALRHATKTPIVLLILGLQVLTVFCFANFEGTLALLTKVRWNYDTRGNGFLFMYVGFWLLICQGFVVRRYMSRVGEARFAKLGTLLLAGGLLGIALQGPPFFVLPVAVLGFSMISPSLTSLLSRNTPADMQGEVLGLGQSGLALARIFGPWAGNLLFAVSPERPYFVAAGLMVVGFVFTSFLRGR